MPSAATNTNIVCCLFVTHFICQIVAVGKVTQRRKGKIVVHVHFTVQFYTNGIIVILVEMDSKSGSQANNGVESSDGRVKSTANDKNALSKQMPRSNAAEPKQRVIKQIVSLDSKKLKALGIESNILSALTKFNGKDKSIGRKTVSVVKHAEPSTSSIESPVQKSTINRLLSPAKQILATPIVPVNKTEDAVSPKKIQVLSNVLLSKNKLDLTSFTAIASSPPENSKHISCVSKVPRPSQIKSLKPIQRVDQVPFSKASTSIVIPMKNVQQQSAAVKIQQQQPIKLPRKSLAQSIDIQMAEKHDEKLPESYKKSPIKIVHKSPFESETKLTVKSEIETISGAKITEVEALKGFSVPEIKCSQDQFDTLQSGIHHKPTDISSVLHEHRVDIKAEHNDIDEIIENNPEEMIVEVLEIVEQCDQKPQLQMQDVMCSNISEQNDDLSDSSTTSEIILSNTSSSDSESDLDELIMEAKMTIENERNAARSESPGTLSVTKKPRLVQKKFLDQLADHIDKDRLIDEFLDSTINSFQTNCDSLSDSSDDDEDFGETNTLSDSNEVEGLTENPIDEIADSDGVYMPESNREEALIADIVEKSPRKRRISIKADIRPKRKRSQLITQPDDTVTDSSGEVHQSTESAIVADAIKSGECATVNRIEECIQGKKKLDLKLF